MKEDKLRSKFKVYGNMCKAGFFIVLFFIGIQVGGMYVIFKQENPDSGILEFINNKEVDEYNTFGGSPSEEFTEKVARYNNVTRTIYIALSFFIFFEIFQYLENKKKHWITKFIELSNQKRES